MRDALWFLTRQWQFGEFQGEDAGSPIDARLAYATTKLARYVPRTGGVTDFPQALPLKAVVEREPAPADLATHRQILRNMTLALEAEELDPITRRNVLTAYRVAYPLDTARLAGAFDGETRRLLLFEGAHLFDGLLFIADIPVGHDAKVDADFGLSTTDPAAVKHAARVVETWFAGLYSVPDPATPSTWSDPQLEYQFACETAPLDGTAETLLAPSYAQRHLDWFAFDLGPAADAGAPNAPGAERRTLSFIPAAVSYAGMPNPRYWQFEDRHVEFTDVTAATTDVAKLLLMEFALCSSNDWCLIPLELAVNSLCRIEGLVVTDVFGQRTLVRAAGRGPDAVWQRWSMFDLSQAEGGAMFAPLCWCRRPPPPRCGRRRSNKSSCCATRWPTWSGRWSASCRRRPARASTAMLTQMRSQDRCRRSRRPRQAARSATGSAPTLCGTGIPSFPSTFPAATAASGSSVHASRTKHRRKPRDPSLAVSLPDRRRSFSTRRKCRAPAASSPVSFGERDQRTGPSCCGSDDARSPAAAKGQAASSSMI